MLKSLKIIKFSKSSLDKSAISLDALNIAFTFNSIVDASAIFKKSLNYSFKV
jgi:hypothetical protein